ncbi:hypothetical protein GFS24_20755 [Chitinophaga sp. SYP-B3965]|uniref:abortive infection system antitoxin AbiGi family protein n=1 Tax=Chitinophaga sp. SYP-B3965 TaxID=2663120 RepID=UPI001299A2CD|nr:abortive infection system antitoxin AbiGi family protein [Chitinophaga sp. SYP-B3965]MRG47565.1 hypothetical protein [Chitinophaga sp. SYP-B3965]
MADEISKEIKNEFKQKKVNHVFHYTKKIDFLLDILASGFKPSYCKESINDVEYYIPMVSFCNIPLMDVDDYIRYGEYGIGLSLEWAVKNGISPVVYVHENTPFADLHRKINTTHTPRIVEAVMKDVFAKVENPNGKPAHFDKEIAFLVEINQITVPALQFFKNWKTEYDGKEITTYLEREWRFVPEVQADERLISQHEATREKFDCIPTLEKPHFPDNKLEIANLDDLRYIMIKDDSQRSVVLDILKAKFSEEAVIDAILSGKLLIFTGEHVRNDF